MISYLAGHIPSALHRLDHIPLGVSEIEFTADEYIKAFCTLGVFGR